MWVVKRDRSCQEGFCIHTAIESCPKCKFWFCVDHIKDHDCKQVEVWQQSAAILNQLRPDQVELEEKGGKTKVTIKLPKPAKRPSREDWKKAVSR